MKKDRYINIVMDIPEEERRETAASFSENNSEEIDDARTALHNKTIELSEQKGISYREAMDITFKEMADAGVNKNTNPYREVLDELVGPLSDSFLKSLILTEKDLEQMQIHKEALRIQILEGGSYRDAVLKVLKALKERKKGG